ncbi:MAG: tetratricopeptide repeat protein [Myxococcaceae bacterium]|nr:tetratricopeptide repeat protein [Myxococcaceae bacterium]
MAVELEPLLNRLAGYAPHFGRLQADLEAMVSRGRAGDYKGVMQNARLVLEALLRSLVSEELKQTPGKAMLDELITKFRQQANAGMVPTTILAHMGTVQAWGNLSSHDHAGKLDDQGVSVGQEEVVASLNSMLAVLSWFATRRGITIDPNLRTPAPVTASGATAPRAVPPAPKGRSPLPLVGGVVGLAVLAGVGVLVTRPPPPTPTAPLPVASPFAKLDAVYAGWKEPAPPIACRRPDDAARLAAIATDPTALALVDPTPESAYLLSRATWEQDGTRHPSLERALGCPGFAAAFNLAGRIALKARDVDQARRHFIASVAAAPSFVNARFNLALLLLQAGELDEARDKLDRLITDQPDFGEPFLLRAAILELKGDTTRAGQDACEAARLGVEKAKAECARLAPPPQ